MPSSPLPPLMSLPPIPGKDRPHLDLMRPLPTTTQAAPLATKPAVSTAVSQTLELGPLHHSTVPSQNRRANGSCPVQRAYPWLLIASTALAAVFCGLYLNKPVIV